MSSVVLSEFQTKAIQAVEEGKHVLITAQTGCGKTLPAEHAIRYFTLKGKNVIYTSPIKALSNQKFNEFSKKFENVGIMTGDNKHNPTASVLIMTTEILQNKLLNPTSSSPLLDFDVANLGCVIFDEVHYINDADRGTVWEQTIMLLREDVQLVMLSATIGKPERFAAWIESVKHRPVEICSTSQRIVPLSFYQFFTATDKQLERLKAAHGDAMRNQIEATALNQFVPLTRGGSTLNEVNIDNTRKYLNAIRTSRGDAKISRKQVLNQLCKSLKEKDMFPALCFVFSRKQIEEMAREITTPLFDEGELDYEIEPVCRQMLVARLRNWKEYVMMPEYRTYIDLFRKGIAIHHAGMLPVFREMVEILYEQRHIKMLLATETFAIGLNMPTKTVCFTRLVKHDGHEERLLHPHEFTQMAGRAGRRGIDTIGHVVLLANLFQYRDGELSPSTYQRLLHSPPNVISSKFKLSYDMVLHHPQDNLLRFAQSSMLGRENQELEAGMLAQLHQLEAQRDALQPMLTLLDECQLYRTYKEKLNYAKNSERKQLLKRIQDLETQHPRLLQQFQIHVQLTNLMNEISNLQSSIFNQQQHLATTATNISFLLGKEGFTLEPKRTIAQAIHEVHPLVLTDTILHLNCFQSMDIPDIFSILSCFLEFRVDNMLHAPPFLTEPLDFIKGRMEMYEDYETKHALAPSTTDLQYDLMEPVRTWMTSCNDEASCLLFLQSLKEEKNVFTGEFIKVCLKLTNIAREIDSVCERPLGCVALSQALRKGTEMLLKFVCTNQSLYL
jgi:superfamily II RNA helicase